MTRRRPWRGGPEYPSVGEALNAEYTGTGYGRRRASARGAESRRPLPPREPTREPEPGMRLKDAPAKAGSTDPGPLEGAPTWSTP